MNATAHSFGMPLNSAMRQITKHSDCKSGGHSVTIDRHSTSLTVSFKKQETAVHAEGDERSSAGGFACA